MNNSDFAKSHWNTNGKHCYSRDIFYGVVPNIRLTKVY